MGLTSHRIRHEYMQNISGLVIADSTKAESDRDSNMFGHEMQTAEKHLNIPVLHGQPKDSCVVAVSTYGLSMLA
jgi:predicted transcriptional regulator